jgi:mitofusin
LDQERCRREILGQLRDFLPETYQEANELVHFVSAKEFLSRSTTPHALEIPVPSDYAFIAMESRLRSFLLDKRTRSKLNPAKTYLSNLLTDMCAVTGWNRQQADTAWQKAARELEVTTPVYLRLCRLNSDLSESLESQSKSTLNALHTYSQATIDSYLASVEGLVDAVPYQGIFFITSYAESILSACQNRLSADMESIGMSFFDF